MYVVHSPNILAFVRSETGTEVRLVFFEGGFLLETEKKGQGTELSSLSPLHVEAIVDFLTRTRKESQ